MPAENSNTAQRLVQASEARFLAVLGYMKSPEHNIIAHLLSRNGLHSELLKRSLPVFQSLARHDNLGNHDIRLLWNISEFRAGLENHTTGNSSAESGRRHVQLHESVTSTVFDLLKGLISSSDDWTLKGREILSYLSEFFSQIKDLNCWKSSSLELVQSILFKSIDSITRYILFGDGERRADIPRALDVLWHLSLSSHCKNVADKSFKLTNVIKHIMVLARKIPREEATGT